MIVLYFSYDIIYIVKERELMRKNYFDMDGVLADFDGQPNALERFINERGFFTQLKPTCLCKELEEIIKATSPNDYYILSSSPNKKGDIEKMIWIYENIPSFKPENVIFVRGGDKKKEYAKPNDVLVDDYSENLIQWEQAGGVAIKCLNGRNGKGKKWKGATLTLTTLLQ